MRAAVDEGGNGALQCSQLGLSSSTLMSPLDELIDGASVPASWQHRQCGGSLNVLCAERDKLADKFTDD